MGSRRFSPDDPALLAAIVRCYERLLEAYITWGKTEAKGHVYSCAQHMHLDHSVGKVFTEADLPKSLHRAFAIFCECLSEVRGLIGVPDDDAAVTYLLLALPEAEKRFQ